MSRIGQDAADTLQGYEDIAQFMASERARWAKAQPPPITDTWAPTMTERQKKEHDQYVIDNNLPF